MMIELISFCFKSVEKLFNAVTKSLLKLSNIFLLGCFNFVKLSFPQIIRIPIGFDQLLFMESLFFMLL